MIQEDIEFTSAMDSRLSAEAGARPAGRLPAQASAPVVSISPPHQAAILSPRKSPQTTPVPKNIEAKKTSNFFERLFSGTSKANLVPDARGKIQELFDLPADEQILYSFSCSALTKRKVIHGRCFYTRNHFCFRAESEKVETKLLLPWDHIEGIQEGCTSIVQDRAKNSRRVQVRFAQQEGEGNTLQLFSVDQKLHQFNEFASQREYVSAWMKLRQLWTNCLMTLQQEADNEELTQR